MLEVPGLAQVWTDQVAAYRAQARAITGLLDYRARIQDTVAGEHLFLRGAADKSAVHDTAGVLGVADRTAVVILNAAGFLRQEFPKTWQVFAAGGLDVSRLRRIAEAPGLLPTNRGELLSTLDAELCQIAPGKTGTELKHWLARRVPELDAAAYQQRCHDALTRRYARIEHNDDATSYLEALLPSLEPAVIEKRLRKVATSMDIPQPTDTDQKYQPCSRSDQHTPVDHHHQTATAEGPAGVGGGVSCPDGRTRTQRQADLLSAWLRTGTSYGAPVEATICLLIPEATLTGETDQPGLSADRSWKIPADQARKLATDPHAQHHWYTRTTHPPHDSASSGSHDGRGILTSA